MGKLGILDFFAYTAYKSVIKHQSIQFFCTNRKYFSRSKIRDEARLSSSFGSGDLAPTFYLISSSHMKLEAEENAFVLVV